MVNLIFLLKKFRKMILNKGYKTDPEVEKIISKYIKLPTEEEKKVIATSEIVLEGRTDIVRTGESSFACLMVDCLKSTFKTDLVFL
jgi:2',3'-cyclic-nucleotide 2'-phosphodiesterase (5'-nucleotidase family)